MRDHRKLNAFDLSDKLAVSIYQETRDFPSSERFGLRSQIRRSAVSVPVNIVEGCGRGSDAEFNRFLFIALGSAREVRYLVELSQRLGFLKVEASRDLADEANVVCAAIVRLLKSRSAQSDAIKLTRPKS